MAPRKQPWFRFYVEAVGDLKLARLTAAQKWLWVVVLAAAKQSAVEGWLMLSERVPMTTADLARLADMRERDVTAGIDAMETLGLVELDRDLNAWCVVAWSRRQYESDNVTERTRKHRSRNGDGTFHPRSEERSGNDDGTHQITETETEPETTPPAPPSTTSAAVDGEASPAATKRKRRLPDDWKPNDQHAAYAVEQGIDLELQTAQFCDHHAAKGTLFVDWDRAFWTWLRNTTAWRPRGVNGRNCDGVGKAWEQVITALQQGQRPKFDDRTESAIAAIGGWTALRTSANQVADRAHFIKFWEAS